MLKNYIFYKTINKPKRFGAFEKTFGARAPEATPPLRPCPLVLVGLGLGVGEGLGLGNQIAISMRGVIIWQGVENGHNTGSLPPSARPVASKQHCSSANYNVQQSVRVIKIR